MTLTRLYRKMNVVKLCLDWHRYGWNSMREQIRETFSTLCEKLFWISPLPDGKCHWISAQPTMPVIRKTVSKLVEGESATFTCVSEAKPPPALSFQVNGVPLSRATLSPNSELPIPDVIHHRHQSADWLISSLLPKTRMSTHPASRACWSTRLQWRGRWPANSSVPPLTIPTRRSRRNLFNWT